MQKNAKKNMISRVMENFWDVFIPDNNEHYLDKTRYLKPI